MYGYLARPSCGSRLHRLLLDLAWLVIQPTAPMLPDQPIFYPVLNQEYATRIARARPAP